MVDMYISWYIDGGQGAGSVGVGILDEVVEGEGDLGWFGRRIWMRGENR
jgi:hypothetical protein